MRLADLTFSGKCGRMVVSLGRCNVERFVLWRPPTITQLNTSWDKTPRVHCALHTSAR